VIAVDPAALGDDERDQIESAAATAESSRTIDLSSLPADVADQLLFALQALSRGEKVAAVADGKPLTTTEAANLLGMSRSHLTQLCDEGRIESFQTGSQRRISAQEVMRLLTERSRAKSEARQAAATAEDRRRARAARAAAEG
jgi:excisionase family DNA binding protein